MNRPTITEFMGDGFTLDKAHKQYLENLELWNYVQALDAYVDELLETSQSSKKLNNDLLADVSGSLRFNSNDVDGAYLLGVFNTTGIDGLAKEVKRIKEIGINPSQTIDILKRSEQ